ncbi:MAG: gamma-glutamyl-gamma-aminobutyrate hydrolase family protein [Gammaproteobacteria bacterium]|nr:MAG: gamma-glutamyl-gamma-aminobutyrate hydrolase family protein [Gammaproteobacteria bacterium]
MSRGRPLIGVISDRRLLEPHVYHLVGEKYLVALAEVAGGFPVALPVLPGEFDVLEALERIDGLLLTGSYSNVQPALYRAPPSSPATLHDPERDRAAMALVPAALRAGLPLFGICRGLQELNVALGGSLHQAVHELPGFANHQEDPADPLHIQYGPAHEVRFTPGGRLAAITGREGAQVNSVHGQGIDRLADGLAVEAVAPDGLIEAVSVPDAPGFALAVQWHPEWRAAQDEISIALFQAFGDACRRYRR